MKIKRYLFFLFAVCFVISAWAVAPARAEGTAPLIREEVDVVIDGIAERWHLEWEKPPVSVCGPEDNDWWTCPCSGFAFGEAGQLSLIRQRKGHRDERLSLADLFTYEDSPAAGLAVLKKWTSQKDDQLEDSGAPEFIARIKARRPARIMQLKDYDHDGRATEFILQIGTLPCGKEMSVIVGISRSQPSLHVFTSVKNPGQPLILQRWQWESLSKSRRSFKVIHWACGDHGADDEVEYELKAQSGRISAIKRVYECRLNGARRGPLKEKKEF